LAKCGWCDTGEEFLRRLQVFIANSDLIEQYNAQNNSYVLSHNQFSHLTWEEFRERMNLGYGRPKQLLRRSGLLHRTPLSTEDLPKSVDWVAKHAVTEVKNQGNCGSCWAFSAVGCLEGAYAIKTGKLKEFSEQMLVDCDNVDQGCNGGLMTNAFEWVMKKSEGICSRQDYAYTSGDTSKEGQCQMEKCEVVEGTQVKNIVEVEPDEQALMSAVAQQPVSVAIEADQIAFQFYKSGIFTARCGTNLDHGVLLVGYGEMKDGRILAPNGLYMNDKDPEAPTASSGLFWKVKNSWGPEWGMDGFILLERGKDQEGGQCGIALSASYVQL
jgi:C1A family cysteine protease